LDASPALCLILLALTVLPLAVLKAHSTRLTGDEVYTLRIAQQPTIASMLHLSRQIDLHPPLHYLLQRASLATHLPIWLASRAPSILATTLTLALVFLFVARRLGNLFGLLAASILWFTPIIDFAWLNRPYALWLCLLTATAVFYQRATEPRRNPWLPLLLFLAALAMLLDYMAGLACLLPFFLAEAHRTYRRKRLDPALCLALILPCFAAVLYLQPLAAFATNSFVPQYLHSFDTAADIYLATMTQPLAVLAACIFAATVLLSPRPAHPEPLTPTPPPAADLLIAISLFALPLLLAAIATIRHTQFFSRYGACGAIGFAFLVPWILLRYVPYPRAVATLMTLALLIAAAVQTSSANFEIFGPWRSFRPMGVTPLTLDRLNPTLPLAIANPGGYTEMNDREPAALLARTFYLYDRESAAKFSGSTVFETEAQTAALMGFHGKTAPLAPFLSSHRQFYLVADYNNTEEWLPRKLLASGATLQYLGKFQSTYADEDLYLVTAQ